jgi:hypothetical protein
MIALTTNIVAVIGAVTAVFAAFYAWRQAQAAQRQNEISLHQDRLKLYRETVHFGAMLAGKGPRIAEADVWKFRETAELAEFFFPGDAQERLNNAFDNSLKLLATNDEWQEAKAVPGANAKELNAQRYKLAQSIRDECFSVAESMKGKLRLG